MHLDFCDAVEQLFLCDDVDLSENKNIELGAAIMCLSEVKYTVVNCRGSHFVETPMELILFGNSLLLGKRHHIEIKPLKT